MYPRTNILPGCELMGLMWFHSNTWWRHTRGTHSMKATTYALPFDPHPLFSGLCLYNFDPYIVSTFLALCSISSQQSELSILIRNPTPPPPHTHTHTHTHTTVPHPQPPPHAPSFIVSFWKKKISDKWKETLYGSRQCGYLIHSLIIFRLIFKYASSREERSRVPCCHFWPPGSLCVHCLFRKTKQTHTHKLTRW